MNWDVPDLKTNCRIRPLCNCRTHPDDLDHLQKKKFQKQHDEVERSEISSSEMLLNIFNAHRLGSRINPPEEREGWRQEGETPACLGCPPPARRRGSAPAEPENSGGGVAKWGEWPPCWGGGLWKTGGSSSIVTILPRKYFNGSKWHFCCPHCGQVMGWNLASKL